MNSISTSADPEPPPLGLDAEGWDAPLAPWLADGHIWFEIHRGFRTQQAGEGLLAAFLNLADADDGQVLAFAKRWGVLGLCLHGLPLGHDGSRDELRGVKLDGEAGTVCLVSEGPAFREPVALWREYAGRARALVSLSSKLDAGTHMASEQARRDFAMAMAGPSGVASVDFMAWVERFRLDRATVGREVAAILSTWLSLGRVGIRVWWGADSFAVRLRGERHGMFATLAERLFVAVTGRSLALCHHCGVVFQPSRQPAAGRRSYCDGCRIAGVSRRDAARDYQRRTRAQA